LHQEPVYDGRFAKTENSMGMLDWTEKSAEVLQQGGVIGPDERLPWPQTAVMGRAARHRDVRRHGAGAHPHGIRPPTSPS
jgi:hypothetical protein